jgi:hypothetical protein
MGPMLCFWYDQRTFNKACLAIFISIEQKLIEFIQYLSMKINSILKNDFAIIILR